MAGYNAANWYWLGQPTGYSSPILYSSAANALVSLTDTTYLAWVANGNVASKWPVDGSGTATTAALDAMLMSASPPLPPSGIHFGSLASTLIAAASAAAQSLIGQAYTDPVHSAAGALASTIVAVAGGAPSSG